LARALHRDASTVTRQLTTLERGGFVERQRDPLDGRSTTIALTSDGKTTMRRVQAARRRRMEALVKGWNETEKAQLGSSLMRLNESLVENVTKSESGEKAEGH
jgi:DNA-binding MarR family transcriptional regulator